MGGIAVHDIAVFWDYENVGLRNRAEEIQRFLDFLREQGRMVLAKVYADWTAQSAETTDKLYRRGMELVQVPCPVKNSVDTKMITDAMDVLSRFSNITKFVIVAGDYDYRALLSFIRQYGKYIVLVVRVQSMSPDLADMVDEFHDISSLVAGITESDAQAAETTEEVSEVPVGIEERRIAAFVLLQEAVETLQNAGNLAGIGMTKNVMIVRNPGFDEKELGYERFADFVADAVDSGYVCTEGLLPATILTLPGDYDLHGERARHLDEGFKLLSSSVRHLEKDGNPTDPSSLLAEMKRHDPSFSFSALGYSSFMSFLRAAEHRQIVELEKDLRGQIVAHHVTPIEAVSDWLSRNIIRFFGENARVPGSPFPEMIANELDCYNMTLEELEAQLSDASSNEVYQCVLDNSAVGYLPPYQKSLFFILLSQNNDLQWVVAEVNKELILLGIELSSNGCMKAEI